MSEALFSRTLGEQLSEAVFAVFSPGYEFTHAHH